MRMAGAALPCIVYHIVQDGQIDALTTVNCYLSTVELDILASTLAECVTIEDTIRTALHAASWTVTGHGKVLRARCLGASHTTVGDSDPGDLDDTRMITLTVELLHSK